jgi:glycerophosphoryl diester phosphodiesterase
MAAFAAAVDLGFRYLETDVHATADGALLAFHDATLDRVTDGAGAVGSHHLDALTSVRLGGTEPIPLLQDVLGAWPDVRVNIDVKADTAVGPLLEVLARTCAYERVCIGSFSDRRLRGVRGALPPGTATSAGPREVAALKAATRVRAAARLLPSELACVQVPVAHRGVTVVDEAFVTTAHRLGLQVHVWTINEEAEMRRLLDLGVDALVTDEARLLRDVLAQVRG